MITPLRKSYREKFEDWQELLVRIRFAVATRVSSCRTPHWSEGPSFGPKPGRILRRGMRAELRATQRRWTSQGRTPRGCSCDGGRGSWTSASSRQRPVGRCTRQPGAGSPRSPRLIATPRTSSTPSTTHSFSSRSWIPPMCPRSPGAAPMSGATATRPAQPYRGKADCAGAVRGLE